MRYRGECMQLVPSVDSSLGVRLAAFLIFLHHILKTPVVCFPFPFFFVVVYMVWPVLLCSRTRYASILLPENVSPRSFTAVANG